MMKLHPCCLKCVSLQCCRSEKELNRRKDMLASLRSRVNEMASTLSMPNFSNRDSLFGPEIKPDAMSRTNGLDNKGVIGLQRQIMKGHLIELFENALLVVCSLIL